MGKAEPHQAMVVCDGFHLFLDQGDKTPPPEPSAGTTYQTVVSYYNGDGEGRLALWHGLKFLQRYCDQFDRHLIVREQRLESANKLAGVDAVWK